MSRAKLPPPYAWSSVDGGDDYRSVLTIWVRPRGKAGAPGQPTGIPVTFTSLAELEELANVLRGSVAGIKLKRERAKRRGK